MRSGWAPNPVGLEHEYRRGSTYATSRYVTCYVKHVLPSILDRYTFLMPCGDRTEFRFLRTLGVPCPWPPPTSLPLQPFIVKKSPAGSLACGYCGLCVHSLSPPPCKQSPLRFGVCTLVGRFGLPGTKEGEECPRVLETGSGPLG